MSYRVLRASEIGEYVYCRRAWWLRRIRGHAARDPARLAAGSEYHRRRQREYWGVVWARRGAVVLLILSIALLAYAFAG